MKIASVILVVSTLYFSSFALYGLNMWDEGVAPVGAVRVLDGEAPVEDFKAYAPGRYYILAGLFKLFGISLPVFRYLVAAMTGLMVALNFQVLYWAFGWIEALFGSALLMSAPAVYYNRFYGFAAIIIIFSLAAWIKKGFSSKFRYLIVFCFFVAYLLKSEVSIMGVLTYILLVIVRKPEKRSLWWKAEPVFLYSLLVVLSYLFFHPKVPVAAFSYEYVVKIFTIFTSWSTDFPPLSFLFKTDWQSFESWLFYIPLILYVLTFVKLLKEGVNKTENSLFLCAASMGCLSYALVVWRAGLDNLMRCLPPFFILISLFLGMSLRGFKKNKAYLGVIVSIFIFGVLFLVDMNVKHGYYVGSIGAMWEGNDNLLPLKSGQVFVTDFQYQCIMEGDTIFKKIGKGVTMLPLPFNPIWNFLLELKNPLPYDWVLPGEIDDVNREWYISNFRKKMPDSIIFIDIPIDGREDRRLKNYAPHFFDVMIDRYLFSTEIGPFSLYLKKAS